MKKNLLFSVLVFLCLSCTKEDPKPAFKASFTISNNGAGLYTFMNNSVNTTGSLWDLGDGKTSTATNIQYRYARNDTYQVKLTAYGEGNESAVTTKSLKVTEVKGSLVVYKKFATRNNYIDVWVDGDYIGLIDGRYYYTSAPSCGNINSATTTYLSEGVHTVVAVEQNTNTRWSTTSTIVGGSCSSLGLN